VEDKGIIKVKYQQVDNEGETKGFFLMPWAWEGENSGVPVPLS
jgi:hypothetical protein